MPTKKAKNSKTTKKNVKAKGGSKKSTVKNKKKTTTKTSKVKSYVYVVYQGALKAKHLRVGSVEDHDSLVEVFDEMTTVYGDSVKMKYAVSSDTKKHLATLLKKFKRYHMNSEGTLLNGVGLEEFTKHQIGRAHV